MCFPGWTPSREWMFKPLPSGIIQGGSGHWAVYYTSLQSFTITFTYSLAYQLWGLFIDLIGWIIKRCLFLSNSFLWDTEWLILFIIIGVIHKFIGHCLIPLDPWVYYACVFVESIYGLIRTTRLVFNFLRENRPVKKMTSQKILEKKTFFCFLVFLHSSLSQRMAESQKWELKYRLVNTTTLSDEC